MFTVTKQNLSEFCFVIRLKWKSTSVAEWTVVDFGGSLAFNACVGVWMTHQVGLTGCMVLLCAHADQAIVVEENAKWVTGSNKDVDSQIKFVALH